MEEYMGKITDKIEKLEDEERRVRAELSVNQKWITFKEKIVQRAKNICCLKVVSYNWIKKEANGRTKR